MVDEAQNDALIAQKHEVSRWIMLWEGTAGPKQERSAFSNGWNDNFCK